jgi:cytochrome c-type protein NapB
LSEPTPPPAGGPAPPEERFQLPGLSGRWLVVWVAVSLTAAVAGYVSGVAPVRAPPRAPAAGAGTHAASTSPMPTYAELRDLRRGDNGAMYAGAVARLVGPAPDPAAEPPKTAADWTSALAWRASRRAYAGAPPTIPHPIGQRDANACLACHLEGATVAGRTAPLIAHPRHESCVQCHVAVADAPPWVAPGDPGVLGARTGPVGAGSTFVGLETFGRGPRAHAGAPPMIPHPTLMRTHCESCHGGKGLLGLRTPHPFRQSCVQCHAPSAALDQRVSVAQGPAPMRGAR